MGHEIIGFSPSSIARRKGLQVGEVIEKINGEQLIDDIDYQALTAKSHVILTVRNAAGQVREVEILKPRFAPLGLKMADTMSLKARTCRNKCLFCFIDQMPKGMRKSLYVKDDDWRLSLMMGNFVTLTNVDDEEFDRIIRRKASPLYISVHATDPQVRVRLMQNPAAARIQERLFRLKENGISFHCQIVLCPGLNDGSVLDDTLTFLTSLYPYAKSAALVPVGLTKCRDGLYPLENYQEQTALQVLEQAEAWQQKCLESLGTRFVFPSDEFYCKAHKEIPEWDFYEEFPQIENGVGLLRRFEDSLANRSKEGKMLQERSRGDAILIPCGVSVSETMKQWIRLYAPEGANVTVLPVINHFFGETVTVTGLLTGRDVMEQVNAFCRERGVRFDRILLCENMLRNEGDLFLDDFSLDELKNALAPSEVCIVRNTGEQFYESLL